MEVDGAASSLVVIFALRYFAPQEAFLTKIHDSGGCVCPAPPLDYSPLRSLLVEGGFLFFLFFCSPPAELSSLCIRRRVLQATG